MKLLDTEQETVGFPSGSLPAHGCDEHPWGRTAYTSEYQPCSYTLCQLDTPQIPNLIEGRVVASDKADSTFWSLPSTSQYPQSTKAQTGMSLSQIKSWQQRSSQTSCLQWIYNLENIIFFKLKRNVKLQEAIFYLGDKLYAMAGIVICRTQYQMEVIDTL